MKFIVMAGGLGTKLWPVSRKAKPKQFIKLLGEKTLIQMNIEGILEKYKPNDIYISIGKNYVHYIEEQLPQIPKENLIIEPPIHKGTGPATCYAFAKVASKNPDEVIMFYVQPVCIRTPNSEYIRFIEELESVVRSTGSLVTGGRHPRKAETGSDLMILGSRIASDTDIDTYKIRNWFDVVLDRMSELQVEKLINENKVVTHCNHYTWTWREFYQSLKVYKPDWYTLTSEFLDAFDTKDEDAKVANIFEHFETERIEVLTKQLFNKGKGICMILPFHWEHITTWDDIYHYYIQNNIKTHNTKVIEIDSKNNLIISDNNKLIAMIGMEDFVLVETKDVIFISPRNKISEIKDLLDTFDSSGSKKYL